MTTTRTRKPCPRCARQTRDGLLCGRCVADARATLGRIIADWHHLTEAITRQDNLGPRGASGRRTWGIQIGDGEMTAADIEHLLDWMHTRPDRPAASQVAEAIRASLWPHVRDLIETHPEIVIADTVPAWCGLLSSHLGELRHEPDAHLIASEIAEGHRSLLAAIDYPDDRARIDTGRPCPERIEDPDSPNNGEPCGSSLLAVIPEGDTPRIECPECWRTWRPQQWTALIARVAAREAQIAEQISRSRHTQAETLAQRYMTPAPKPGSISVRDAAVLYGVPAKTLYRWVDAGRLTNVADRVLHGFVVALDPRQVAEEAGKRRQDTTSRSGC